MAEAGTSRYVTSQSNLEEVRKRGERRGGEGGGKGACEGVQVWEGE